MIKPIKSCYFSPSPAIYGNGITLYEEVCKLGYKVNEIINDINDNLETYIEQNFNRIMVQASYDEDTETIKLSGTVTVENATHAFDDNTLIIQGKEVSN